MSIAAAPWVPGGRDGRLPDLSGSVVLVTGASGTVGAGIAGTFARAGAAVMAHFHTNPEPAEALVAEIIAAGGQAAAAAADLCSERECTALVDQTVERFGRLDTLVNNAGVQPTEGLADLDLAAWRRVVDTNLAGVFACTQAAARAMRGGGGNIIHIASIEGSHPAREHAHYCASKAAVVMHARTAALEYGRDGIRVNTVSPGLIDSAGLSARWPEGVRRWAAAAPLSRLGTARDVGMACVFLASGMAEWITGANLLVDGGVSCHPTW